MDQNPHQQRIDAALAAAQFTTLRKRELRKQEARTSGIKLIARGLLLAIVAAASVYAAPPSWFTPLMVLATLGGLVAAFGGLKVFASTRI